MLNKLSISALSIAVLLLCSACNSGGSSQTQNTRISMDELVTVGAANPENANAFTVVVGPPFVDADGTAPIYESLYTNLTTPTQQGKLPVARILLAIENPGTTAQPINNVFRIGNSFTLTDSNNGQVIALLSKLAKHNATASSPIEIYAYPDVESSSNWESWQYPSAAASIPSCVASNTVPVDTDANKSQKAMLHSICWVSAINKLIGGAKPVITGVAYDNQSNYLAAAHQKVVPYFSPTGWTYGYAHGDTYGGVGLNLGWVSAGGIADGTVGDKVDLNLIEVYDLYSNKGPYFDSVVAATVTSTSPPFLPTPASPSCIGTMCAFEMGVAPCAKDQTPPCTAPFFPGYQYEYIDSSLTIGAVGANIYECAISSNATQLAANGCNAAYSGNIDLTATPDVRLLQSLNYIKFNLSPLPTPRTSTLSPIYGSNLLGNVVYLFSTQYAGPVRSYFNQDKNSGAITSSRSLCIDNTNTTNLCSCIASQFDRYASCGDENSFGSWGNNLTDFKNFVMGNSGFLSSQGGSSCPGKSCSAGIYMYDFIPQAWYR